MISGDLSLRTAASRSCAATTGSALRTIDISPTAPVRRPPPRDLRTDAAPAQLPAMPVRVVAPIAIKAARPASGRPGLPRTGGIASTSGIIGLTSGTLAAVVSATSGIPPASVMIWCLLPFLRRSTGLGPVRPPPPRARTKPLSINARFPVDPVRLVQTRPRASRGASARPGLVPVAEPPSSRSCRNRSPSSWGDPPS